jgi:hypothetical protein
MRVDEVSFIVVPRERSWDSGLGSLVPFRDKVQIAGTGDPWADPSAGDLSQAARACEVKPSTSRPPRTNSLAFLLGGGGTFYQQTKTPPVASRTPMMIHTDGIG